jgi:hypothetical protein
MSTVPSARPSFTFFISAAGTKREACATGAEAAETVAEGPVVLARQQGRGHHDGHLLAAHGGHEGGAQGHLRLAEAHVAADQPVHGPAGAEVAQRRVDGVLLVLRFLVGKAGAELVVEAVRRQEARRLVEEAAAAIFMSAPAISRMRCFMRALRACQAPPPSRSRATSASSTRNGSGARCSRRGGRADPPRVVQLQAVVRRPGRLDGLQAFEASDAMVDVDHQIAGGERRDLGQKSPAAASTCASRGRGDRRGCPARR